MLRNRLLASWVFLMFLVAVTMGQGATGLISGTVTDQNGAVIGGAAVTVTNVSTNFKRETTTNGDGAYSLSLLPAGTYVVTVSASNFAKQSRSAVVNIAQTTSVDVRLEVGA